MLKKSGALVVKTFNCFTDKHISEE